MDNNELFKSIYSQASAAREPMQESFIDTLDALIDDFYAKKEEILGPEEE